VVPLSSLLNTTPLLIASAMNATTVNVATATIHRLELDDGCDFWVTRLWPLLGAVREL